MPLPRDPDTLRVPAFMRKRSLSSRLRKPLVLTALDRKKTDIAGKVKSQKAKVKIAAQKSKVTKPKKIETFSAPLLDFYAAPPKKSKSIGIITHYYEKIHVGVIKLSGALSVGDCITYETAEGPYEQIVESMEIDREPVFKAGRGKEIGLKLNKMPAVGCKVLKN